MQINLKIRDACVDAVKMFMLFLGLEHHVYICVLSDMPTVHKKKRKEIRFASLNFFSQNAQLTESPLDKRQFHIFQRHQVFIH